VQIPGSVPWSITVDATNWSGFTPGSGGAAAAIQGKRSRPTFLFDDKGLNTEKHGNGMHGDGPGAVQLSELIQVRQKLPGSLLFFHRPAEKSKGSLHSIHPANA
jgi:hypothetical protein